MNSLKTSPVFYKNTILLPFLPPVILTGKKEDGNYAFVLRHNERHYYIFATLQNGVINNNLPPNIEEGLKVMLLEAVNLYCQKSREGLPENLFVKYAKNRLIKPA
ncbi:MAG: hypothetical protein K0R26_2033 [Bacteroidota bacterium]|jgi:hypothetical protein|nr:hypothetical protein [Bacteroidota bacterium]